MVITDNQSSSVRPEYCILNYDMVRVLLNHYFHEIPKSETAIKPKKYFGFQVAT